VRARGGTGGLEGGCAGVRGQRPRKKHIFFGPTYFRDHISPHDIRWFSAHGFLPMVFYFWLRN
jgi:hypothetical protein